MTISWCKETYERSLSSRCWNYTAYDAGWEKSQWGPGIAPADLPQLFHPFFTRRRGGHGLGLAVSQNIVLEHGGELHAQNREDRPGAVFELLIPLVR